MLIKTAVHYRFVIFVYNLQISAQFQSYHQKSNTVAENKGFFKLQIFVLLLETVQFGFYGFQPLKNVKIVMSCFSIRNQAVSDRGEASQRWQASASEGSGSGNS